MNGRKISQYLVTDVIDPNSTDWGMLITFVSCAALGGGIGFVIEVDGVKYFWPRAGLGGLIGCFVAPAVYIVMKMCLSACFIAVRVIKEHFK